MKNRHLLSALILVILVVSSGIAQNTPLKVPAKLSYEKYAIGVSPSALLNTLQGIQLSHDFGITDRLNLTFETGYLFWRNQDTDLTGYRLKAGIQYLLARAQNVGFVMGIHYLNRNSWEQATIRSTFPLNINDGTIQNVSRQINIHGGEITLGLLFKLSDKVKGEFALGAGNGYLDVHSVHPEPYGAFNTYVNSDKNFLVLENLKYFPIMSFNINFSYAIIVRK